MSNRREAIIGCNFYQPPRESVHHRLQHINTDPLGINWTKRAKYECYDPLEELGVLNRISYNAYGILDQQLGKIDSFTQQSLRSHLRDNGIADTYIHALLPDLSREDKRILIKAGTDRFEAITDNRPKFIWLPEAAVDTDSLEILSEHGIEGFLCSPAQIEVNHSDPNNIPVRIWLPSGRHILAIAFDRDLSSRLGYDCPPIDRSNAYRFVDNVVLPALSRATNGFPVFGFTDGETFGHHMQWGGAFIDTLVNHALPSRGVNVVSINKVDFSSVYIPEGKIRERSSWSCPDIDLSRWHGGWECRCCGWDVGWKREFYHAVHFLNGQISQVVKRELGNKYLSKVSGNFELALQNTGVGSTPELSLISAKISALKAVTSCATFFEDPGKSGNPNILAAMEAIEYLKDAGLMKEAEVIKSTFLNNFKHMVNPVTGKNGVEMARDLIGDEILFSDYLASAA